MSKYSSRKGFQPNAPVWLWRYPLDTSESGSSRHEISENGLFPQELFLVCGFSSITGENNPKTVDYDLKSNLIVSCWMKIPMCVQYGWRINAVTGTQSVWTGTEATMLWLKTPSWEWLMINDGDQNPNHPENRSRMIWFGAHMSSPLSSSHELTAATIVKPLPLAF